MTSDDWPFDQPRNCATFTVRQIMSGEKPILMVVHDAEDHGWQFLDGGILEMKNAVLVSLEEVVNLDPSVREIATMEPGYSATRSAAGAPWSIEPAPADSAEE